MARSAPFLAPTSRNSIDRQWGHWATRKWNISQASVLAALLPPVPDVFRDVGPACWAPGPLLHPPAGRLASRAALISSGVRTSGSDTFTFFFARATARLCRFTSCFVMLLLRPVPPGALK